RAGAGDAGRAAAAQRGPRHGARASRVTVPDGQGVVTVAGTAPGGATSGRYEGSGSPDAPALLGGLSQQGTTTAQNQSNQDNQMSADLERKLRRQFLNDLSQMNDAALAEYLATPEGQHIAALLQYYAADHPSSTSNQTANGILDRVPDRGGAAHGRR